MTDEPDPRPNPRPEPTDADADADAAATGDAQDAATADPGSPANGSSAGHANGDGETRELVAAGTGASPRGAREGGRRGRRVEEPAPAPVAAPPFFDQDDDLDEPAAPYGEDEWVKIPRRSSPMRRAAVVVIVLGLVVGVTGVSVLRWVNGEIHPAGDPGDAVEFTIEQGDTTNVTANNLAKADIIGNATVFRYWLRRQGGEQTFRAGDYDLFERMDYPELLEALRKGPKPPVSITVTVLPGLTLSQMKVRMLENMPGFDPAELDAALVNNELAKPWNPAKNIDGTPNLEGVLFPDTYSIDEETASNEFSLVKRMSDQMDQVLTELNAEARAAELGYSLYEVITVASLIEEEAKIDADRPKIARVIYNRLERDTPLGIDATTRYETGKLAGEPLLTADFESDSPYNTRRSVGLPPTPISMPTRASIEAALSPTPGERWMYYVLTNEDGVSGAHRFVVTAREFEQAKQVCIDLNLGCG